MGHESVVQARKPTGLGSTPPTVRPGIVERPALLQLIDDAVARHRVVLVQAPPGTGRPRPSAAGVPRPGAPAPGGPLRRRGPHPRGAAAASPAPLPRAG